MVVVGDVVVVVGDVVVVVLVVVIGGSVVVGVGSGGGRRRFAGDRFLTGGGGGGAAAAARGFPASAATAARVRAAWAVPDRDSSVAFVLSEALVSAYATPPTAMMAMTAATPIVSCRHPVPRSPRLLGDRPRRRHVLSRGRKPESVSW